MFFRDYATTAKAPLFILAPGNVIAVGDVPHIMVAVKWYFVPMLVESKVWVIGTTSAAPPTRVIIAAWAVNDSTPLVP